MCISECISKYLFSFHSTFSRSINKGEIVREAYLQIPYVSERNAHQLKSYRRDLENRAISLNESESLR